MGAADEPPWDGEELTFQLQLPACPVEKVGRTYQAREPLDPPSILLAKAMFTSVVLAIGSLPFTASFGWPLLSCIILPEPILGAVLLLLFTGSPNVTANRRGIQVDHMHHPLEQISGVSVDRVRSGHWYDDKEREWVILALKSGENLALRVDHEVMAVDVVAKLQFLLTRNQGTRQDIPQDIVALRNETT